jgi:hypothetical protein
MATITSQPTQTILCINEPVKYEFEEVLTGVDAVPSALEVQLELDGTLKDVIYLDAFEVVRNVDTFNTFKINVSELLIKHFERMNLVNEFTNFTFYRLENIQSFRLKITPWLPNTEGVLIRETSSIFTTVKYLSDTVLKENETLNYFANFFLPIGTAQFLTTNKNIRLKRTGFCLVAYSKPLNNDISITVKFYNALNAQIGRGILEIPDSNTNSHQFVILNLSPSVIESVTFDATLGITDVNMATYYTVECTNSEVIKVTICETCTGYRLHFLNRFGLFDSVTLNSDVSDSFKTRSSIFERAKSVYNVHSTSVLSKVGQKQYEGFAANLSPSDAVWLEELLNSPLVYLEENGLLLPVIIDEDTYDTKRTGEMTDFRIKFYLSNKRKSQRN